MLAITFNGVCASGSVWYYRSKLSNILPTYNSNFKLLHRASLVEIHDTSNVRKHAYHVLICSVKKLPVCRHELSFLPLVQYLQAISTVFNKLTYIAKAEKTVFQHAHDRPGQVFPQTLVVTQPMRGVFLCASKV